jgi:predicted phosphodiesterase
MQVTAKGKIVQQYLERYPQMPNLTLAKKIFKDKPLLFASIETIRTLIRAYKGVSGEKNRLDNYGGGKHYKDKPDNGNINFSPYKLPEPLSEDYKPFKLPKTCSSIGIFGDFHIPNHRIKPITLALDYFKANAVDTIILNGDVLDNTPFTRHDHKTPSPVEVRDWFDMVELFFTTLRKEFPKAKIYWCEGNHDAWYSRWMREHAWQLEEDPYFSLQERLHIKKHRIEFIPQTRFVLAGKLVVVHGHHLVKGIIAPVNAARGVFNRAKVSAIISHVHVTSEHTETNLLGHTITDWSLGCMCTLTPDYQPMGGKANFGFAHVQVEKSGNYKVTNKRIVNGEIV